MELRLDAPPADLLHAIRLIVRRSRNFTSESASFRAETVRERTNERANQGHRIDST